MIGCALQGGSDDDVGGCAPLPAIETGLDRASFTLCGTTTGHPCEPGPLDTRVAVGASFRLSAAMKASDGGTVNLEVIPSVPSRLVHSNSAYLNSEKPETTAVFAVDTQGRFVDYINVRSVVADGIELAALSDKFFHPLTADSQGVRLVRDHVYVARLLHEGTVVSGTPRCFFQLFPPEIATLEPSGRDSFKVASKTGAPGLLRITCGDLWKTIPIAPLDFGEPPSDAGGDDGADAGDASLQGDAQ